MASKNPVFKNNPAFSVASSPVGVNTPAANDLQAMFDAPARPSVMTYENTIQKTLLSFVLLLLGAAAGWVVAPAAPLVMIGALVVGLVLGLVNSFKREPSPPLILAYAVAQGVALGGISAILNIGYPGIALQAVLATLVVVGTILALFASGKVRATPKMTKIFMVAMISYLAFSVVNIILVATGVVDDPYGVNGSLEFFGIPLGVFVGVFAVILASYSLVLDFDFIQHGVDNKIDSKYGWTGAFGLMVTIVWLYMEMLRILSHLRR